MLITSIQELRLASPAHALDSIDGLVGFIDNSEHDFLEDKLGTPLYNALCQWYDENPVTRTSVTDYNTGCWNRLLLLAQRVVAFDALGRAAGMQGISVNNAGINQMVADDYRTADEKAITTYRDTCTKEAHAALNQLLRQLEQWCKETTAPVPSGSAPVPDGSPSGEKEEIAALWHHSRYYYLAASMLIPSCEVLQSYLNIYDSREKFIQLLPDLQFIQEEFIANSIGEDLLKAVIDFTRDGLLPVSAPVPDGSAPVPSVSAGSGSAAASSGSAPVPDGSPSGSPTPSFSADSGSAAASSGSAPVPDGSPSGSVPVPDGSPSGSPTPVATMQRLVHRLRKVMVSLLVGRTAVLKYTKEQKIQAHDDGVRMLQNVIEYLRQHQSDFPAVLVKDTDWYIPSAPVPDGSPSGSPTVSAASPSGPSATVPCGSAPVPCGSATVPCGSPQGNCHDGLSMLVTAPLL